VSLVTIQTSNQRPLLARHVQQGLTHPMHLYIACHVSVALIAQALRLVVPIAYQDMWPQAFNPLDAFLVRQESMPQILLIAQHARRDSIKVLLDKIVAIIVFLEGMQLRLNRLVVSVATLESIQTLQPPFVWIVLEDPTVEMLPQVALSAVKASMLMKKA
jgi:hypothetical protein